MAQSCPGRFGPCKSNKGNPANTGGAVCGKCLQRKPPSGQPSGGKLSQAHMAAATGESQTTEAVSEGSDPEAEYAAAKERVQAYAFRERPFWKQDQAPRLEAGRAETSKRLAEGATGPEAHEACVKRMTEIDAEYLAEARSDDDRQTRLLYLRDVEMESQMAGGASITEAVEAGNERVADADPSAPMFLASRRLNDCSDLAVAARDIAVAAFTAEHGREPGFEDDLRSSDKTLDQAEMLLQGAMKEWGEAHVAFSNDPILDPTTERQMQIGDLAIERIGFGWRAHEPLDMTRCTILEIDYAHIGRTFSEYVRTAGRKEAGRVIDRCRGWGGQREHDPELDGPGDPVYGTPIRQAPPR